MEKILQHVSIVGMLVVCVVFMLPVAVKAQPPVPVTIEEEYSVQLSDLTVTVSATGTIQPKRTVDLFFSTSATVQEILVDEGDVVRDGDTLAILDAETFEASLREAEIALQLQRLAFDALVAPPRAEDVLAAEAAVVAAEAQIPAARTGASQTDIEIAQLQAEIARNQLWQTQLNRDKLLDLNPEFRGGYSNQLSVESSVLQASYGVAIADAAIETTRRTGGGPGPIAAAESALIQAQVSLDRLLRGPDDVQLLQLEIQLDQAEAALESARVALDRAKLVAPFNGVVAEMNLEVGELPAQTSPAVVLLDASAYYVDLLVDENDVVNIQLGQTVSFRVDALPEASITGSIERLLITPTASTNSEVVTYQARVRLNPSTEPIRVGMSTTANITTKDLQDIIVVPNRFIRIDRQTRQAFVTIQNSSAQTEEIAVELGERNNEVSQIVGGLEPGQRIVRLQNASEVLFGNPN